MSGLLLVGLVVGVVFGGLWMARRAARQFAERQRKLGRWDAEGPLVETAPPPSGPYGGSGMSERLEVAGEWHGEILRDRRPKKDPAPVTGPPQS
jgi:hypothetical protein